MNHLGLYTGDYFYVIVLSDEIMIECWRESKYLDPGFHWFDISENFKGFTGRLL